MEQELKQKWIEALISGKYNQITSLLRTDRGHCCLGVLCEVAELKVDENGENVLNEYGNPVRYKPLNELLSSDHVEQLWRMNDIGRKTFLEIAHYINENL